jgi:hypothetical protein
MAHPKGLYTVKNLLLKHEEEAHQRRLNDLDERFKLTIQHLEEQRRLEEKHLERVREVLVFCEGPSVQEVPAIRDAIQKETKDLMKSFVKRAKPKAKKK